MNIKRGILFLRWDGIRPWAVVVPRGNMSTFWYFVLFVIISIILILILPANILHWIITIIIDTLGILMKAVFIKLENATG